MKKMLFSVIALVAFSVTSIAEVKPKTENKKSNKTDKKSKKAQERNCDAERQIAYLAARGDGFSHADASGMAYHIYFWCMSSKFVSAE
ncbi:hypothetical protein [Flavobacterium urocaniciphilum]|uniref:Uncharacterized protein n=1 Tax=Flavobacterium urocaniciphilum TaxID=1299341 RepID=A0A1H9BLI3_9FLAO|nr:hypothetical protein [Flavobacterium urocaniciphilum]SEP89812.1 hypothetical protein SAMN05444005_10386 [Flavobacterium urocaniciphilum]